MRFQFHKGTIRTDNRLRNFVLILDFNSIKVRLELKTPLWKLVKHSNFNSIKVRLELM